MLSMRGGYLATEYSRDTSSGVALLNNSGITVKECAGHIWRKQQSANISWGMRFEGCRQKGCGWRLDQSEFRSMAEELGRALFSRTRQRSEHKKKRDRPLQAGKG